MENKSLIKTDTVWYKIKSFFSKIFRRKNKNIQIEIANKPENEDLNLDKFQEQILYQNELQEQKRKEDLANQLLNDEIDEYELDDEQIEEMTEYFEKDIEEQKRKLERIKKHILEMQKQLQN